MHVHEKSRPWHMSMMPANMVHCKCSVHQESAPIRLIDQVKAITGLTLDLWGQALCWGLMSVSPARTWPL